MACSMSITSVTGIPATPGGTITSTIHVTGTVAGTCAPIVLGNLSYNVVVKVDCPGGGSATAGTGSSSGNWAVDVPIGCKCGSEIFVRASCATDETCTATFTGPLTCEAGNCPTGAVAVAVGECNPGGTRNVTLTATLATIPSSPVVGEWDFGDGTTSASFNIMTPGLYSSGPHPYAPPGPFTAMLLFVLPVGCPPLSVTVPGLAPCDVVCPEVGLVTSSASGVCNADGTRTVNLNAMVTGGTPQTYHWEYGDNTSETIIASMATPAVSHDYPAPGTGNVLYTATFTVTGLNPSCVDTATHVVNVPGCGGACPTVSNVTATAGACTPAKTRPVALDADVTPGASEYNWNFGDASPIEVINATITPDPATSHDYAAPGSYTATITIKGPTGCPDQSASTSFNVASCGSGGNGGGGLCGSLLLVLAGLVALATAATIFTLALTVCPMLATVPVPGWVWGIIAGLWIAVAAVSLLWALLCGIGCPCPTACDWAAIAWVTSLTGFIVALYLSGCCGGAWWLLVAGFAAGFVAGFTYWFIQCNPGACRVLDLLLVALASIAAVAITYISAVPIIMACGLNSVSIAVATIIAVLAVAVPTCHSSGP